MTEAYLKAYLKPFTMGANESSQSAYVIESMFMVGRRNVELFCDLVKSRWGFFTLVFKHLCIQFEWVTNMKLKILIFNNFIRLS